MGRRSFFKSIGKVVGLIAILPLLPFVPGSREDKIAFIKRIMKNAINSHDDILEKAIFS